MPDWLGGFWTGALKALDGHQEAVLALVVIVAAVILEKLTQNPYFAFGLPVAIYVLYIVRMIWHAKHEERLAELNIEKLERTRGTSTRARANKALQRRRK
jgi:uncharacterized membrane protein YhhN